MGGVRIEVPLVRFSHALRGPSRTESTQWKSTLGALLVFSGCALGDPALIAAPPDEDANSVPVNVDVGTTGPDAAPPVADSHDPVAVDAPPPAVPDGHDESAVLTDGQAGSAPLPGEVVISEVMVLPSGTLPEEQWIELYNTTATAKLLSGLTLTDGHGTAQVIPSSPEIAIEPHAYAVLARSKASAIAAGVPAATVVYEYGLGLARTKGILLSRHTDGGIRLSSAASVLSNVPYGPWINTGGSLANSPPTGPSLELKAVAPDAGDNAASWCIARNTWPMGHDKGTPGSPNDCP
jgi:hypothetical protein